MNDALRETDDRTGEETREETGREFWGHPSGFHRHGRWSGAVQTLGVLVAFVGFGVGWAHLQTSDLAAHPAYPGSMPDAPPSNAPQPSDEAPEIWLVDGFNVLHASLLGGRDRDSWWTEARRDEVMTLVRSFEGPGSEVWVVFDGPRDLPDEPLASSEASGSGVRIGVKQVFAPSADEWLLRRLRTSPEPGRVVVVTADRRLAARARHRGAQVVAPGDFLSRCRGESGPAEHPA